jgi:hypothetical protein
MNQINDYTGPFLVVESSLFVLAKWMAKHSSSPSTSSLHHIPRALATTHKLKVHQCHFTSQTRSKDRDKPINLFSQCLTQTNHPQLKSGSLNLTLLKRHRRFLAWPCRNVMEAQSKR